MGNTYIHKLRPFLSSLSSHELPKWLPANGATLCTILVASEPTAFVKLVETKNGVWNVSYEKRSVEVSLAISSTSTTGRVKSGYLGESLQEDADN